MMTMTMTMEGGGRDEGRGEVRGGDEGDEGWRCGVLCAGGRGRLEHAHDTQRTPHNAQQTHNHHPSTPLNQCKRNATPARNSAKLLAELPVGAFFPLVFGSVVYPLCGLNPKPARFAKFLGILTLESFSASALGLAVGAVAPSAESAVAIGPAVILVHIVFGGLYVNVRGGACRRGHLIDGVDKERR